MQILHLCEALSALQIHNIWGTRLPTSDVHPLQQPLILMREKDDARVFLAAMPDIFTHAWKFDFGGSARASFDEVGWMYGFIGRHPAPDGCFRAAMAAFLVVGEDLFTPREVGEFLDLVFGDRLTVSPLFVQDGLKAPSESRDASTDIPYRR